MIFFLRIEKHESKYLLGIIEQNNVNTFVLNEYNNSFMATIGLLEATRRISREYFRINNQGDTVIEFETTSKEIYSAV